MLTVQIYKAVTNNVMRVAIRMKKFTVKTCQNYKLWFF